MSNKLVGCMYYTTDDTTGKWELGNCNYGPEIKKCVLPGCCPHLTEIPENKTSVTDIDRLNYKIEELRSDMKKQCEELYETIHRDLLLERLTVAYKLNLEDRIMTIRDLLSLNNFVDHDLISIANSFGECILDTTPIFELHPAFLSYKIVSYVCKIPDPDVAEFGDEVEYAIKIDENTKISQENTSLDEMLENRLDRIKRGRL